MWSSVEQQEIGVFLTLAAELHFGRTAERHHLTSSRVSQIIRRLEEKLGTALVHRTSRRVELTDFGERFRAEVGPTYATLVETLEHLSSIGHKRQAPLLVNTFSDPTAPNLVRIVKAFEALHPDCEVRLAEVPIADPFGPLHRSKIDLMTTWLPHGQPGLVLGPLLSSEPRVVAVARDHPLTQRSAISVEDLADYRVMRFTTLSSAFHEEWIPSKTPSGRPIPHQIPDERSRGDRGRMTTELLYLILTGKIVHPTVPSFASLFAHPDIVHIPIADMPPLRSALVWRQGPQRPAARDFIGVATATLDDASAGSTSPSMNS